MVKQRAWLMVVILVILAPISISTYQAKMLSAREAVLNDNLAAIRSVIKHYITDKQMVPQSLQDLVDSGYFRELPMDPITNSRSSWKPVIENVVIPGTTGRGITDVHSGSSSTSSNGTIYGAW